MKKLKNVLYYLITFAINYIISPMLYVLSFGNIVLNAELEYEED